MADPLIVGSAASIPEVVDRMRAIEDALPHDDGVAWFNRMYLQVTTDVGHAVTAESLFTSQAFLDPLDVTFANLYFAAFDADARDEPVPPPWAPLFKCRDKPGTHPIQFAFAGMNAHINHDLGIAVVQTCIHLSLRPEDATPQHHDFVAVNLLLDDRLPAIKQWFVDRLGTRVDRDLGRVDDAFERWGLAALRAGAWETAKLLWMLREHPHLHDAFVRSLARSVEVAGHGLLI